MARQDWDSYRSEGYYDDANRRRRSEYENPSDSKRRSDQARTPYPNNSPQQARSSRVERSYREDPRYSDDPRARAELNGARTYRDNRNYRDERSYREEAYRRDNRSYADERQYPQQRLDARSYRDERTYRDERAYTDQRPQRGERAPRDERLYRDERTYRDEQPRRDERAYRDQREQRDGRAYRDERTRREERVRADERAYREERARRNEAAYQDDRARRNERTRREDRAYQDERASRRDMSPRSERASRSEAPARPQRASRTDAPARQQRSSRTDASARQQRSSRTEASTRQQRSSRTSSAQERYPVGSGRAYQSTRQSSQTPQSSNSIHTGATGVNPVVGRLSEATGYIQRTEPGMSRRRFVTGSLAAAAGVAAVGLVGFGWWNHRAVTCSINGVTRQMASGATVEDVFARNFAARLNGDVIAVSAPDEKGAILRQGEGGRFILLVNGEERDPDTYRLKQGDEIEILRGPDEVEEHTSDITILPCGVQYPPNEEYLAVIGYVQQWGKDGQSAVVTGLESGLTVDMGVVEPPQDLIIATARINPADGRRLVALTFDDGPSLDFTPQYLDILARYGAKATFFNLGVQLDKGEEFRQLAKRCVDEGHQVASHTYSHSTTTLTGMDLETRNWEIRRTAQLIADATGVPTHVLRPPYGELRGRGFAQYLASGEDIAYSAYWSVDSDDWDDISAEEIVERATHDLDGDNYNGAVILMHDGQGYHDTDVEALPRIIEKFQSNGYELVTMNEMLAADPTFPEWVTSGYVTRPEGAIVPPFESI